MHTDEICLPYALEVRSALEFAYEPSKTKLLNVCIASDHESHVAFLTPGDADIHETDMVGNIVDHDGRRGRLLRLSATVDLESRLSVGCAGAVLTWLHRRKAANQLLGDDEDQSLFKISAVSMFNLDRTMYVAETEIDVTEDVNRRRWINADTLASLQILQIEAHPQSHNQGPTTTSSGSKEGLSVYGLFSPLARTPQGKDLLRKCFLRPSLEIDVIQMRLNTIEILIAPENHEPLQKIARSLQQIKNMKTVIIHLRKGVSNGPGKGGGIRNSVWSTLRSVSHDLKSPGNLTFRDNCDSSPSIHYRFMMPFNNSLRPRVSKSSARFSIGSFLITWHSKVAADYRHLRHAGTRKRWNAHKPDCAFFHVAKVMELETLGS